MKNRITSFYRKVGVPVALSGILMAIIAVSPGIINNSSMAKTPETKECVFSGIPRVVLDISPEYAGEFELA